MWRVKQSQACSAQMTLQGASETSIPYRLSRGISPQRIRERRESHGIPLTPLGCVCTKDEYRQTDGWCVVGKELGSLYALVRLICAHTFLVLRGVLMLPRFKFQTLKVES